MLGAKKVVLTARNVASRFLARHINLIVFEKMTKSLLELSLISFQSFCPLIREELDNVQGDAVVDTF